MTGIEIILCSIFIPALGFLLSQNTQSNKKVAEAVEKLNITIGVHDQKFTENEKDHETTVKRLDSHANQLKEHEKDITFIKTKIG